MPLSPGTRLGPYEITGALGAGGMGEVHRARDPRLNRDVAIKALPELFTLDPERVARFEREAQLLAALSHPNIGGIHGLEESSGQRYLVLELIPGESLAQRLASGPLPLDEALAIARQIAEALEAAHEKGIVHRDLKPGNVMLTPEGQVKVLDFGLAKATGAAGGSGFSHGSQLSGIANSPTFASPAMTAMGLVIGTASYMAPEQAKGRGADKRSDVWAFGCVLYEMLTGVTAFAGEDISDTLAAVLRGEPDWSKLPKDTPASIERLVRRCLQKDRAQRIPDISIARFEIAEWMAGRGRGPIAPPSRPARGWRTAVMIAAGVVAGAGIALAVLRYAFWPAPPPATIARFEVKPPAGSRVMVIPIGSGMDVAVAPDGSRLVYAVSTGAGTALALRQLDRSESTLLPGTGAAQSPSISPDGTRVAFIANRKLHVLLFGSSAPIVVSEIPGGLVLGTRWLDNDTIVFARRSLFKVAAGGGTPELLVEAAADETLGFPESLRGGHALVYTVEQGARRRIVARALPSGEPKVLADNATFPRYLAASGHLLFMQNARLVAARFDPATLQLAGTSSAVGEDVSDKMSGGAGFDVSATGVFAATEGNATPYSSKFILKARDGAVVGSIGTSDLEYPRYPRVSPDGKRMVATVGPGSRGQLWMFDLAGTAQPLKLTFSDHNLWPTWTPDGKTLIFTRLATAPQDDAAGRATIMTMPSDGSVLAPQLLVRTTTASATLPVVSPDGRSLLFTATTDATGADLMVKPLDGKSDAQPWLAEAFHEREAAFSPDGRWVAFVSTQTGTSEVWVRAFPGPGAPIRVSPAGGREPVWSRNQKELFYQQGPKLMAAAVTSTSPALQFGLPRPLFEGGFVPFIETTPRTYDVTPDGRFLMIEDKPNTSPSVLGVVSGWHHVLAGRLPK